MLSVRRFCFTSLLCAFSLSTCRLSQVSSCFAQTAASTVPGTAQAVAETQYKIEPSVVVPGGSYTFVITAPPALCKSNEDAPFKGVTPQPSSNSDLRLGTTTPFTSDPCRLSLAGSVSGEAESGDLLIYLQKDTKDKNHEIFASLRLKVKLEKAASPIPPGLNPEVDLMWKVLPRRVVADSYGNRVADQYFAIETVIGNNSGWDLQIAALGFDTPYYDCVAPSSATSLIDKYNLARQKNPPPSYYVDSNYDPCGRQGPEDASTPRFHDGTKVEEVRGKKATVGSVVPRQPVSIDMPTPIDAYPVVRSTIEREQHVGRRAVIVNLVKASGSTLVGIGGLLPDAGNFVKTTSIYNGPFEKGIELVYPDLTTLHLIGLDNRTLRDGTVVPNNTSVRVNVFISREIIMCAPPSHWWYFDRAPKKSFGCVDNDARVPYQHDFNPADIRERLGELTVVGRKIQYLERVRVLSKTSDLPESKPGIIFAARELTIIQDTKNQSFTLGGVNLGGVTLTSGSPKDLVIKDQKVSADGSSITFLVDTAATLKPPARIPITATSSRGTDILSGDIKAHSPVLSEVKYLPEKKQISVKGSYLDEATPAIHDKQGSEYTQFRNQPDGANILLNLNDKLDADSDYTVSITTDGGSDQKNLHTPKE